MEALSNITVQFVFVLALSFLIERILEILKAGYDLLDCRLNWHCFWTGRAQAMKRRLESRIGVYEYVEPRLAAGALQRFSEVLRNEDLAASGAVPVISGDLIRELWVKAGCKILGIGIGILLAWRLNIDILQYWDAGHNNPLSADWLESLLSKPWTKYLFTGTAIGLGTGPLHKIIVALENTQKDKKMEETA